MYYNVKGIEMIKVMGKEWIAAISTKLACSGFGYNRKEALEALRRSMRSIIRVKQIKN